MISKDMRKSIISMIALAGFILSSTAQADPIVIKAYKQTFPDEHPKCINCHLVALPKKADGQHDWNAYGTTVKKAINAAGVPDVPTADNISQIADVFTKVGKAGDFKDTTAK